MRSNGSMFGSLESQPMVVAMRGVTGQVRANSWKHIGIEAELEESLDDIEMPAPDGMLCNGLDGESEE